MRISDWSSDVCSSDLGALHLTVNADVTATGAGATALVAQSTGGTGSAPIIVDIGAVNVVGGKGGHALSLLGGADNMIVNAGTLATLDDLDGMRAEEHTSDLPSLMRRPHALISMK